MPVRFGSAILGEEWKRAAIIALCSLGYCCYLAGRFPPSPLVNDEFSYLLAADTFLHGRLSNSPHQHWVFFESYHINHQPRYVSKYPPLQGVALAMGSLVAGSPIFGAWVAMVGACLALYWMLRGWLSPAWAFLGGMLCALNGQMIAFWGVSYWGGAVPMLGASLVYGALPRFARAPARSMFVVLACGACILMLSRPYEGVVSCLPAGIYLIATVIRQSMWRNLARLLFPGCAVFIVALLFFLWYNYRTTGEPLKMPYQVNGEQYPQRPVFLFQSQRKIPTYNHPEMERFYREYAAEYYDKRQSARGFLLGVANKSLLYLNFFVPSLLSFCIIGLVCALGDRQVWFMLGSLAFCAIALFVETYEASYYAAPFVPLVYFVVTRGLQGLVEWRFPLRNIGLGIAALAVATSVAQHHELGVGALRERGENIVNLRGIFEAELRECGGKHLIFVRYSERYPTYYEFVYNSAEIDEQQVAWARDMGREKNTQLIAYYPSRSVWSLSLTDDSYRIEEYVEGASATGACSSLSRGGKWE